MKRTLRLAITVGFFASAIVAVRGDPFKLDRRPENEGGKRPGSQEDINEFIRDFNRNLENYQQVHGGSPLAGEPLYDARRWAFQKWAADHHGDPLGQGPEFWEVKNLEIPSNLGLIDLDWMASLANLGPDKYKSRGPLPYLLGKSLWFVHRSVEFRNAAPDLSSLLNAFPDTNWRAIAVSDLLYSGRVSPEELFRPGQESDSVRAKRAELTAFFSAVKDWGWKPSRFNGPNAWTTPADHSASDTSFEVPRSDPLRGLSPGPVGGIRLLGAGGALASMGELIGLRVNDSSGALELLAHVRQASPKDSRPALDDFVTVVRSVYQGAGPSLSIDPDSQNPQGPRMRVVPDDFISGTWVAFTLYECDRRMKAYGLGVDNLTRVPIDTRISGYGAVLDQIFGGATEHEGTWERFWIAPAARRLVSSDAHSAQFVEIPLEVQTHASVLRKGAMVDVDAPPSPGATAFTRWFTSHYDEIGVESTAIPPAGSGVTGRVNVFSELRRIAALTAVAEVLQSRGVPMPEWMRTYPVGHVNVAATTPSLTAQRTTAQSGTVRRVSIFGGVDLDFGGRLERVRTTALPATDRAQSEKRIADVEAALTKLPQVGGLHAQNCEVEGQPCVAVRIPLADTSDLGACRLFEKDLTVPLGSGGSLALTRYFNSLTPDSGPWGGIWSLGLPRLIEVERPAGRTNGARIIEQVIDVTSPAAGRLCRLDSVRRIPALGVEGLVTLKNPDVIGLVSGKAPFLSRETRQLHLHNGEVWHFNARGDFVAAEAANRGVTCYERDNFGRVSRIVRRMQSGEHGEINLDYDPKARLATASGTRNGIATGSVRYKYGDDGLLSDVRGDVGRFSYRYLDGRVVSRGTSASEHAASESITQYEYDRTGGLHAETTPSGDRIRSEFTQGEDGGIARLISDASPRPVATVEYDSQLRLVRTTFAGGLELVWAGKGDNPVLVGIKDESGRLWSASELIPPTASHPTGPSRQQP